jgi:hypothetical protein
MPLRLVEMKRAAVTFRAVNGRLSKASKGDQPRALG